MILVINNLFSQNKLNGIVLDYETKKPIEYVDIFNESNFTSTNSEGKFLFASEKDSINIRLIGYKAINSTFKEIKNDTIYLESKFEVLDEIVIGNSNAINNVFKEMFNNYPILSYSELFFLRCSLKKDGEVIKLQDLNGIIKRKMLLKTPTKPMPKKNYEIEILNMRKAGIKEKGIYFKMFSFKDIFDITSSITIDTKLFNFSQKKSKIDDYTKHYFTSNSQNNSNIEGYYLINNVDNAILEFNLTKDKKESSFTEVREYKYRTTSSEIFISFKKSNLDNKYFIDKAKIKAQLELITEGKTAIYNVIYSWIRLKETKKEIKRRTSIKKDIFKLKKSYNPEFWDKQEYLLLTDELLEFLEKLESPKKEFKTITNIKKE